MRVLIGCEYSATVRDAFRARGHDAWSCDLLPTEGDSQWHIQGDVLAVLDDGWDLAIFHPPCTFLTYAGAKHLYVDGRKENGKYPPRWEALEDAALFFRKLLHAPIAKIAVENPIMLAEGKKIVGRGYDQIIQPWSFGHMESKRTCLWLEGLSPLSPTSDLKAETMKLPARLRDRVHYARPGPDRWKERSRTSPGIAAAMADQWGSYVD